MTDGKEHVMATFRDRDISSATKAEHDALHFAAMQTGRTLAGGVTHDLNSALQILGDSLYAIKDDTKTLIRAARVPGEAQRNLASSLELADEAFDRIKAITRVVPNLIVGSGDDAGPILVEAELRAIVALTRHHWKNRLNVVVEVQDEIPRFWCKWWVVRLAAMRLVMLAGESRAHVSQNARPDALPTLTISGLLDGDSFVIGVRLEGGIAESMLSPTDSVLTLCAKSLGAEILWTATAGEESSVSLRYPIRLESTLVEAGHA